MKQLISILLMLISTNLMADVNEYYTNDATCLALNIYHEARSESIKGQLAVGMVTLNRVDSKKFPQTVCDVVWQKKQFSWTHDGKSDIPKESRAWKHAQLLANYLLAKYDFYKSLTGGSIDITAGALYYYAHTIVRPYWADSMKVTTIIGGHTFSTDDDY